MNAVAVSKVATLMSNNVSPPKTNGKSSMAFDHVLKKTFSKQDQEQREKTVSSMKSTKVGHKVMKRNDGSKETEVLKGDQKVVTKVITKDTQEVNAITDVDKTGKLEVSNQTEVEIPLTEESLEDIGNEALEMIASILGISQAELEEMIDALDLSAQDLLSNKGLQVLINDHFELTSDVEMLKNPNAFEAFKEIKQMLQEVLNEKGLNFEDIEQQLKENQLAVLAQNAISTNNGTNTFNQNEGAGTGNDAIPNEESGKITLEVVDTRTPGLQTDDMGSNQVLGLKESKSDGKESKNDNFQKQFENVMQPIVSHKVEVVTAQGIKEMIYQTAGAKEIMNQVVTGVKVALTDMDTTMTFQLKPESLGKIAFSVTSQNGVLTGQFVAESSAVKEVIEANMANLKATLSEQGIKLDEVKVVIGNTNQFFEQSNQSKNSNHFSKQKKHKFNEDDGVTGVGQIVSDLKEEIRTQELESQEHMVDFSA